MKTEREIEMIAKVCNQANIVICKHFGHPIPASWEDASKETKESSKSEVKKVIGNPSITSEMTHESWYEFKKEHGWVYGEVKDEVKKTHPCMVPYNELPEDQKIKDELFKEIVKAFL